MSLAPAGKVLLGVAAERATLGGDASGLIETRPGEGVIEVEAFYIDRWPVTNEQYQQFVAAGGYEQLEFWPEEALPAIFDFVDRTGEASPKYWLNGAYPEGRSQQPVVGISWYEACGFPLGGQAIADRRRVDQSRRLAGRGLQPGRIVQRRYPWGELVRRASANCGGRPRRNRRVSMSSPTAISDRRRPAARRQRLGMDRLGRCATRRRRGSISPRRSRASAAARSTPTSKTKPPATSKAAKVPCPAGTTSACGWR